MIGFGSILMRGCGLKFVALQRFCPSNQVTSHARVWIEILPYLMFLFPSSVTSHARVWIEMQGVQHTIYFNRPSLLMRGCGLKLVIHALAGVYIQVTSHARVWIEINRQAPAAETM